MHFDKEAYDCSKVFFTYLAFLGDTAKVGIALKIPREVVEVLAAKEDWPHKLKTYMAFRLDGELSATDRAIRRTVWNIQACHLRDLIGRVLRHMSQIADDTSLVAMFSHRSPKTNRPQFSARILLDLATAFHVAVRIVNRLDADKAGTDAAGPPERDRLSLGQATNRAMRAIDWLPGMDSVGLTRRSLAKWDQDSKQEEP